MKTYGDGAHTNSSTMNTLEDILRQLYRRRRMLAAVNSGILAVAAAVLFFVVENYYDSTVVILPDYGGSSMLGNFSSLAAVAGLNIGESNPAAVYQKLILSESVLEKAVYERYTTKRFDRPVTLLEYFDIEPEKTGPSDPPELQERDRFLQIVERLRKEGVVTELDRITNILTITVRTPEQQLSSDVANVLIRALDSYVRTKRRSNATEQKVYVEERLVQVRDSLVKAEDELKSFREKNRIIGSPQLLLEQSRLLRNVEILQTVFIELTKQTELIKLEEIKDSPIINIQEPAGVPVKKSGPGRAKYLALVLIGSLAATGAWIVYGPVVGQRFRTWKRLITESA